ncbi:DNA-cytosine methyltransferase [Arcticibacter svalbardensis MN12-7]|uniref:Cytosine-specific methyltransferase n=2 Tax=Arcticibacter TaxID=1288026 RepID=R9GVR9_9SPHI|nr:DNA-cytosine methyltransferase [Arcticibacter svalbardensis MN12-7]
MVENNLIDFNMIEYPVVKNYKAKKKNLINLDQLEKAILTHHASTKLSVYESGAEEIFSKFGEVEFVHQAIQQELFPNGSAPFHGPKAGDEDFTFIDLFAGIGGFRMAMQNLNGRCIFSSEYDKYAQETYFANYGEVPFGDITSDLIKSYIPKHFDVICGGFPCQPFSIAGVSKKISLGRLHGFDDVKQGNLFFQLADIIAKHRPNAFFLENVKNLVSHDKGNTFKVIKETLLNLNYSFDHKVIDGKNFVPQHRERTIMVGFNKEFYGDDIKFDFSLLSIPEEKQRVDSILQPNPDPKFTLSDKLWNYLQEYAKKHKEKGNGFGFGLIKPDGVTRTISARYYKDGSEILIPQEEKNPRRLTPNECAALQGYPMYPINTKNKAQSFIIPVSDTQAYKQFGNSVVMPLIQAVGKELVLKLSQLKKVHAESII